MDDPSVEKERLARLPISGDGPSSLWMRPVSFAGLLRILHLVAKYPRGISASELNLEIRKLAMYLTRRGSSPAPTTLYHCRNTLVRLEVLRRSAGKLIVNSGSNFVRTLLGQPSLGGTDLTEASREAFAGLVLQNLDCKVNFFDLFMPSRSTYSVEEFRVSGQAVVWRREQLLEGLSQVVLQRRESTSSLQLNTATEIKCVLYGLRYWARDELRLIDEYFLEGQGSIMYPVLSPGDTSVPQTVGAILSLLPVGGEWTTFSVHDLAASLCEHRRLPLAVLFTAIRWLHQNHSDRIVLIPTSRGFATLTARSRQREEFALRGYYHDTKGRYISHVRVHNSLRCLSNVLTT